MIWKSVARRQKTMPVAILRNWIPPEKFPQIASKCNKRSSNSRIVEFINLILPNVSAFVIICSCVPSE